MIIRVAFIVSLLAVPAHAANSCANLNVLGTYDQSGLNESEFGISAVGSFRIQDEPDENRQPNFNLAMINCEKQTDDTGRQTGLLCKVTKAVTWARDEKPNADNPNCSIDLDLTEYPMRQLQKGVLAGAEDSTSCFNSMLTIDRNTKRVYLSFTRTKYADRFDTIKAGTCGQLPRTEVLMNCTAYPRMRKGGSVPIRYCDFSNAYSK
jgi:hypothetical protein